MKEEPVLTFGPGQIFGEETHLKIIQRMLYEEKMYLRKLDIEKRNGGSNRKCKEIDKK